MAKNKKKDVIHCYNDDDISDDTEHLLMKSKTNKLEKELESLFDSLGQTDEIADDSKRSQNFEHIENIFELQNKVVSSFCDNIKEDIRIKRFSSKTLLAFLIIQCIFLDVIFVLVGASVLKYKQYTLDLFITAGVVEMIGLVIIIIKYIFADHTTESLKIISNLGNDKKS